jgi:Tat protein secretion system quality control protein TatD with DNase activity
MKMKSEEKKKKKKKEKEEKKEKKKKNDAFVEQIAASKQLQMQVFVFVKKTSLRFVAKK